MTPVEIEILLHHYTRPGPYPGRGAPVYASAIARFVRGGILESHAPGEYGTTIKGKKLVDMLCETPFPEVHYADPRTQKGKPCG